MRLFISVWHEELYVGNVEIMLIDEQSVEDVKSVDESLFVVQMIQILRQ